MLQEVNELEQDAEVVEILGYQAEFVEDEGVGLVVLDQGEVLAGQ